MLTLPTQEELDKLREAAEGVPDHIRLKGWFAGKEQFGQQFVYADDFRGMGRQHIASLPASKGYFGTMADFIAAANPAHVLALLDLIAAQQKQIAEQGWISVDERLPPNYEEVMIWSNPTDYIMTAEIYGTSASGNPVWKYGEYQSGWGHETIEMTSPVTHWQPLPPPPEQS